MFSFFDLSRLPNYSHKLIHGVDFGREVIIRFINRARNRENGLIFFFFREQQVITEEINRLRNVRLEINLCQFRTALLSGDGKSSYNLVSI